MKIIELFRGPDKCISAKHTHIHSLIHTHTPIHIQTHLHTLSRVHIHAHTQSALIR